MTDTILTDDPNTNQPQFDNQASFGHELLAGGAAFAGFKAFEDHQRKEGTFPSHYITQDLSLLMHSRQWT